MIQQSTFDQLLLMAYGELNGDAARELQEQLNIDANLAREWHSILRLFGELDHLKFSPSDTSLRIVLDYSYKTEHLQEI